MDPVPTRIVIQNLFEKQHISGFIKETKKHIDLYEIFLEKWDFYKEFISGVTVLLEGNKEEDAFTVHSFQTLMQEVHTAAMYVIKHELEEAVQGNSSKISFSKYEDCTHINSQEEREKYELLFLALKLCIRDLRIHSTRSQFQEGNQEDDYTIYHSTQEPL